MFLKGVFASMVLTIVFLAVTVRAQMEAVNKEVPISSSGKTSTADSAPSRVTYISSDRVAAAFPKGGALSMPLRRTFFTFWRDQLPMSPAVRSSTPRPPSPTRFAGVPSMVVRSITCRRVT